MKRWVKYFVCEQETLAEEINHYACVNDLRIVSLVIADAYTKTDGSDIAVAYVIFEEEQEEEVFGI